MKRAYTYIVQGICDRSSSILKGIRFVMPFIALVLCLLILTPTPAASTEREYAIKAAYMLNFARFVTWPDDPPSFTLCILGSDPFKNDLTEISSHEIKGKKIYVKNITTLFSANQCQLLYISKSERKRVKDITQALEDQNILTIGDSKYYSSMGVMINMFIQNNKVRFTVNNKAAIKSGLEISSHLLELSRDETN